MNKSYIDWIEELGQLRRERQAKQTKERWDMWREEVESLSAMTDEELQQFKTRMETMNRLVEDNFETDTDLQERFWSF